MSFGLPFAIMALIIEENHMERDGDIFTFMIRSTLGYWRMRPFDMLERWRPMRYHYRQSSIDWSLFPNNTSSSRASHAPLRFQPQHATCITAGAQARHYQLRCHICRAHRYIAYARISLTPRACVRKFYHCRQYTHYEYLIELLSLD